MKTIATILLTVAIILLVVKGFSWIWLVVAVLGALVLAVKGLRGALSNTFKSG